MAQFSLGKPIIIGGQEVLVVRDVLGAIQADKSTETYAMAEQAGADGRPAIYVSEKDLGRAREDYPGMKVYGLWQILFFNKAVRLGAPLVVFPWPDNPSSGLYLLLDAMADTTSPASIGSSGEYMGNYIAEYHHIEVSSASRVEVDLQELRLPPQPAYTRLEQSGKLKAEHKRRWIVVLSLCGLIGVGAVAANYGLQTVYKSRLADYTTKKTLIKELDERVQKLSSERLITRPDDSVMIGQLYKLLEYYPSSSTLVSSDEPNVGFTTAHVLVTPPDAPVNPSKVISGAESELIPTLAYRVRLLAPENEGVLESVKGDEH